MLNFFNPIILWALPLGLVPLIIHLFNRHKVKEIPFSTTHFLKQMTRKEMRRLKIRQILLLIIRTLILLFLVLVFARPTLKSQQGSLAGRSPSEIVVILDNSLSLNRLDITGTLLSQVKQNWLKLESMMRPGDRITVLTSTRPLQILAEGEHFSDNLWKKVAEDIQPGYFEGNFSGALLKSIQLFQESELFNKELYILSDFQKNSKDNINPSLFNEVGLNQVKIFLLPVLEKENENISVDSAYVVNKLIEKNLPLKINALLQNRHSQKQLSSIVSLVLDEQRVDQLNVSLAVGEQQMVEFNTILRSTGLVGGYVETEADDLLEDNRFFFNFFVPEKIKILHLRPAGESDSYVPLILQPAVNRGIFLYYAEQLNQWAARNLSDFQVIILEDIDQIPEGLSSRLERFAKSGNGLIILPGASLVPANLNKFLRSLNMGSFLSLEGRAGQNTQSISLGELYEDNPIFEGLFEDRSKLNPIDFSAYYKLKPSAQDEVILKLKNNDPLLIGSKDKTLNIFLFTAPLKQEWTNFITRGFIVPLLYRLIYFSVAGHTESGNSITAGEVYYSEYKNLNPPFSFELKRSRDQIEKILPAFRGSNLVLEIRENPEPGNQHLFQDGKKIATFSVNHPVDESIQVFYSKEELNKLLPGSFWIPPGETVLNIVEQTRFGVELWSYFLWAVLILLCFEMFFAIKSTKKEFWKLKNTVLKGDNT